jgi:hypothetical protein
MRVVDVLAVLAAHTRVMVVVMAVKVVVVIIANLVGALALAATQELAVQVRNKALVD